LVAAEPNWLSERATDLQAGLELLDQTGSLAVLSDDDLLEFALLAEGVFDQAHGLWREHVRGFPSFVWFGISTLSGLGGLLLLEPTIASLLVAVGGAAGAAKAIYDRGAHLVREQRYLGLYWRANRYREALAAELVRRGIRF
jgi:hypothetical protein